MSNIFIAHVEEDADIALGIALGLEEAGFRTWCYEIDTLPGPDYLQKTGEAIEQSEAVVIIISPRSLGSNQVTNEVVRAYEERKQLIPLLRDITHAEFQRRQPVWRQAIGAAASVRIPEDGIAVLIPQVIEGIKSLGIRPGTKADAVRMGRIRKALDEIHAHSVSQESNIAVTAKPTGGIKKSKYKKPSLIAFASVLVIAIILAVIFLPRGGGSVTPTTTVPGTTEPSLTPTQISTATPTPTTTLKPTPQPAPNFSDNVTVITELNVPLENISGIAWDGTNLWMVNNSGDMFKTNTGGEVLGSCRAPEVSPEGLAWDGQAFWMFTTNYSFIYRFSIDESVPKLETRILTFFKSPNEIIGGTNDGLAWDGTNLWYADRYSVYKIDPQGTILDSFAFSHEIVGLTWDGEQIWLAYNPFPENAVLAITDTKGKILRSFKSPVFHIDALTWGNGCLWVVGTDSHGGKSKIYALKPQLTTPAPASTNEGHQVTVEATSTGFLGNFNSRGLAWDGTNLWMTDCVSGKMYKVNTDGETLGTYLSPVTNPLGLSWDGEAFWAYDSNNNTISQFRLSESENISQGQILHSFTAPQSQEIGGSNGGLTWAGTSLWYSDRYNIYELDNTGKILEIIKSSFPIRGLAWDGEYLWLAYEDDPNGDSFLAKINAQGNIILSFDSTVYRVYDLAWGDGYMWALGKDYPDFSDVMASERMWVFKIKWVTKIIAEK